MIKSETNRIFLSHYTYEQQRPIPTSSRAQQGVSCYSVEIFRFAQDDVRAMTMSGALTQHLSHLQSPSLPPAERLKTLQALYSALITTSAYIPPKPRVKPLSFLNRHPRLKMVLSLAFAGFVIFCDGFVGVSTILGELLTLGSVIFVLSLGVGLVLMALVILLQLSLLAKFLDLPFLKPPKTIQHQIEERAVLKQIATFMETHYFYRACQNKRDLL